MFLLSSVGLQGCGIVGHECKTGKSGEGLVSFITCRDVG